MGQFNKQLKVVIKSLQTLSLATLLAFTPFLTYAASASGINITGYVKDASGSGVGNVSVYTTQPGLTAAIDGPVSTANDGSYNLPVASPGTYDLHFVPPSNSGFNPVVNSNISISANQTINVQLSVLTHTISGTIYQADGTPVPNVQVQLKTTDGTHSYTLTTNASGYYSQAVEPGIYVVSRVQGSLPENQPNSGFIYLNEYGYVESYDQTVDATNADITYPDLYLPQKVLLHVTLNDGAGNPVPNVQIGAIGTGYDQNSKWFKVTSGGNRTDYSGKTDITVFKNATFDTGSICAYPTQGSICTTSPVSTANGDVTVTLAEPATHTISGTIYQADGTPAPNVQVLLKSTDGSHTYNLTTSTDGNYSQIVESGNYVVTRVQGYMPGTQNTSGFTYLSQYGYVDSYEQVVNISNTDVTYPDLYLPQKATVTVIVKDGSGNPIPNVSISALGSGQDTNSIPFTVSSGSNTTNNLGLGTITVYRNATFNAGSICAYPTQGSICTTTSVSTANGDITVELGGLTTHTLSGTIYQADGTPAPNVQVVLKTTDGAHSYTLTTNASGYYSQAVEPGTYVVSQVRGYIPGTQNTSGFTYLSQYGYVEAYEQTISVTSSDVTYPSITLPEKASVNVVVKDVNGNPISGVQVSVQGTGQDTNAIPFTVASGSKVTDSTGTATVTVYRNTTFSAGQIYITNAGNNTYTTSSVSTANGDVTVLFQPQPTSSHAPTNLGAITPTKQSPVLNWSIPDNAATSGQLTYKVYRDGTYVGSSTTNQFTDVSVQNSATYSYYVTATGINGIESGASNTATVIYDIQGPDISHTLSPSPNANNWNNSDVTVSFSCSDALTSVQTCPPPTTVSSEGANQAITVTATDVLGNSTTSTVYINIDRSAPTISYQLSQTPNANNWNNSDVTVSFSCSDALSGIDSCSSPVVLTDSSQTATGTAIDKAGNTATVNVGPLQIDKVAPIITAHVSTPPNSQGWNNGAVTITFDCSDALSGIDSCSSPVTVSNEGMNQQIVGTAVDKAGNIATTTAVVSIDKTKPTIVATQTPPANAYGWNNSSVTVNFTCSDSLSGIRSCSSPVVMSNEGANQSVVGTAIDNAGNSTSVTALVNIDKTVPVTGTVNSSSRVLLNPGPVTISAPVSDALSGVARVEYYVDNDPGQGSGTAMSVSGGTASANVNITGDRLSNHTVGVRTQDKAGNWSTVQTTQILIIL